MSPLSWLIPVFALIAATYSSVGLGGATAYAAVLSFTSVPYAQIPPLVLTLNLLVAGSSYVSFHRAGRVPYRLLLPLLAASVPAAFLGGLVPLHERAFLLLLAVALFMAGVRFLLGSAIARWRGEGGDPRPLRGSARLGLGFVIGLLAGMTGIGGGVYLGPVLLLLGACSLETVPAVTGGFVFFNSAAGLAGQLTRITPVFDLWIPLGATVVVGALAGARSRRHRVASRAGRSERPTTCPASPRPPWTGSPCQAGRRAAPRNSIPFDSGSSGEPRTPASPRVRRCRATALRGS